MKLQYDMVENAAINQELSFAYGMKKNSEVVFHPENMNNS